MPRSAKRKLSRSRGGGRIFEKSLGKKAPKGDFTFYEGPPTANGRPGVHHLESRAFKDAVPRYKTMRGYRVARRAGWDTHGLPVELEVEKQLGFQHKKQIEEYGIAAFNKKCRESVFNYIEEWGRFTERIGYWVDQASAYFTFDAPYMEAVWGIFAKAARDERVYRDYRVVPWCPHDETALSSHELALGYQDVIRAAPRCCSRRRSLLRYLPMVGLGIHPRSCLVLDHTGCRGRGGDECVEADRVARVRVGQCADPVIVGREPFPIRADGVGAVRVHRDAIADGQQQRQVEFVDDGTIQVGDIDGPVDVDRHGAVA